MALDQLLEALTQEAETRAAETVAAARREAEALLHEAHAGAERRLAGAVARRESELRAAAQGAMEAARSEAAREVLTARAEALARVFGRARELLMERVGDPALEPRWSRDAAEALTYVGGPGNAVVRRPPDAAGVIVVAADGSMEVDGTVGTLLARLEPRLAVDLARALEADP
jgi:vacuolar-type H+-ATPase subunit E/Vma4